MVLNGLPLTKPDFLEKKVKYLIAKLYVRLENPAKSITKFHFKFYEQAELETQGIDIPNDGFLMSPISAETWTVKQDSGTPW